MCIWLDLVAEKSLEKKIKDFIMQNVLNILSFGIKNYNECSLEMMCSFLASETT
jgi:hypothetical protein